MTSPYFWFAVALVLSVAAIIVQMRKLRGRRPPLPVQCDGCNETHEPFILHPASGDTWLCDRCLLSVIKHGKYPHELTREQQVMLENEVKAC